MRRCSTRLSSQKEAERVSHYLNHIPTYWNQEQSYPSDIKYLGSDWWVSLRRTTVQEFVNLLSKCKVQLKPWGI